MIHYFDTSLLVPYFVTEATSVAVEHFITGLSTEELTVSHLTRLEFSTLLARRVRMKTTDEATARRLDAMFEITMTGSFRTLTPSAADFELARSFVGRYENGLRAGDALHLAIAHNHRVDVLYSLDKGLLAAGRLLGIPVSPGIDLPGY